MLAKPSKQFEEKDQRCHKLGWHDIHIWIFFSVESPLQLIILQRPVGYVKQY